ncbi:MAG TPA: pectinesterase family protein [Bacteroidales bacterium]|nr:pectinesterase family protein [Bacteroidales bacterium]
MKKTLLLTCFALLCFFVQVYGQKTDVWDFGAEQLSTDVYTNHLDSAAINSWYATTITPGSGTNVMPVSFTAGILSWTGGTNDRLRTTNTKLTRYDTNTGGVTGYTGRLYVNASAATGRFLSLDLNEDDIVTLVEKTDAGGKINFQYASDAAVQSDQVAVTSALDTLTFVAKAAGSYKIFDNVGKPSYFRIFRKAATYATISGTVDVTAADGIPAGYGINFQNSAGKVWNAVVSGGTFTVSLPVGSTYTLSLSDASQYVISSGSSLAVTVTTTSCNVVIQKLTSLFTVTGSITGLGTDISKLTLTYTPDPAANKIYVPVPVVDANTSTYSVQLEPDCLYTITASGVNDYSFTPSTITVTANTTSDLAFTPKTRYNAAITITGLTDEQVAKLTLTFVNLNETGYSYSFNPVSSVTLRDGTYSISYSGLEAYPVDMGLTSNLKIAGADVTKTITFQPVTLWPFDDRAITNSAYKGIMFTGTASIDLTKGHLTAKPASTIKVPASAGDIVRVAYYYTASFNFEGGTTYSTASNSTATTEYAEYAYTGTDPGYVTINVLSDAGTSYFPEISRYSAVAYKSPLYVGPDKEFTTINAALDYISRMTRPGSERVVVMIDPGNYEEMLVVAQPNITLKNASSTPDIDMKNKGVDIDANAVRITSYYGHGYNYYSMKNNQKWDADVLRVNKENGFLSYENKGSGTTNGSYWNATVVVNGAGFEAEDIIFENSFNQYISKKESEDVVVEWTSGGKGTRPVDKGNTAVQNRSFVERAAAIAITGTADKAILTRCRVIGRQDSFYGAAGARVAVIKGAMMGDVDYLFGGMTAVFYKSDLVMNTSDVSGDAAYITAAQQTGGRGFLMYKCTVKSTVPGIETASTYYAKPGYFGRPWQATTSEVVFYNTTIDTSNFTGFEGKSFVSPEGWSNSLSGESAHMYEYGTTERSGENNTASRVTWCTVLTSPTLSDNTEINTLNFTKGSDGWDPIPVETDALTVSSNALTIAQPENSSKTFDITSNVSWEVSADRSWLTVSRGSGFDNATITVTATANSSATARTATVTVLGSGVATQTITVTQEAVSTGIEKVNENEISVYPNPVANELYVSGVDKNASISIYNSLGILIIKKAASSEPERIDLSDLSRGIYIIKVDDLKATKTRKFIKR